MANYTVGGYSANSFFVTPEGKLILDPNFDASEDALRYEIEETDDGVKFDGDSANDERGDGDQRAQKYDAQGNLIAQGNVYLEESWTLTDEDGNTITLYKVESGGQHSGWVADGEIIPGKSYDYSGPNDVTASNAPRYDELNSPSYDPDDDNSYEGGDHSDYAYTGAQSDTVDAGGGNDSVHAGDGDDSVDGGDGNDSIRGESGDDEIHGGSGADTISGGADDDTIHGGSGDDQIDGDAGNDQIDGGTGDDRIDGGSGDDRIDGGSGNNTVTGGSGDDTFVQSQDGQTVVTDFDLGDEDSDGSYNDQIDISDLRTADGGRVTFENVVVTDDGNGNAVLTFPMGETLTLLGVSPAQMSSAQQMFSAGIPCFTGGTLISTAHGPVPVEMLRPGDRVQTRDNGLRPIVWTGRRDLGARALAASPALRPIHISPHTFGNDRPLRVSPQHALALGTRDKNGQCLLMRAGHLARLQGGKVRVAHGVRSASYHHLLLESHDLIMAEGIASESLYPGSWGVMALGLDAARDLVRLMPRLGTAPVDQVYGPTIHPVARFRALPPAIAGLRAIA